MTRRILAIDDDPEATGLLRRILEKKGYEVREENDSRRALQATREFRPDVVLLDFLMPSVHGGDVAWQLASDPGLRKVKVIICSGVPSRELRAKLPPSPIAIVAKPVAVEALLPLLS